MCRSPHIYILALESTVHVSDASAIAQLPGPLRGRTGSGSEWENGIMLMMMGYSRLLSMAV